MSQKISNLTESEDEQIDSRFQECNNQFLSNIDKIRKDLKQKSIKIKKNKQELHKFKEEIIQEKHLQMQKLQEERKKFESEQRAVKNVLTDEMIQLNVSGIYFPTVSKKLLTSVPNTILEAMFSGRHELNMVDGKIFIDRDPDMIKYLIRYLRSAQKNIQLDSQYENQMFKEELKYWGFYNNFTSKIERYLLYCFNQEPPYHDPLNQQRSSYSHQIIIQKWKQIGPIQLQKWVIEEKIQLEQDDVSFAQGFSNFGQKDSPQYHQYYGLARFFRVNSSDCEYLYEGYTIYNQIHGYGRQIQENGDVYEGYFKNDKYHGQGKLNKSDGTNQEGNFIEGEFQIV